MRILKISMVLKSFGMLAVVGQMVACSNQERATFLTADEVGLRLDIPMVTKLGFRRANLAMKIANISEGNLCFAGATGFIRHDGAAPWSLDKVSDGGNRSVAGGERLAGDFYYLPSNSSVVLNHVMDAKRYLISERIEENDPADTLLFSDEYFASVQLSVLPCEKFELSNDVRTQPQIFSANILLTEKISIVDSEKSNPFSFETD